MVGYNNVNEWMNEIFASAMDANFATPSSSNVAQGIIGQVGLCPDSGGQVLPSLCEYFLWMTQPPMYI